MRLKIFLDATTILLAGAVVLLGLVLWQLTRTRRDNFLKSRVIAATSSGILITDATAPRHPILHANPAFRLLTGYAEEDVLGQSPQFLNGLHTDRAAIEKIGLALQDGRACRVIVRHYRKNGTPFWNEVTLSPVKNRAGEVVQYIWVMTDATQRQQAEEALKDSHDPSRVISEMVSESLVVCGDGGGILYLNPAAVRLLGADSVEAFVGKPILALFPPEQHETLRVHLDHLRSSGTAGFSREERIIRQDGQPRTVELVGTPILWQGKSALLLSLTDRTAQDQSQSAVQRLAKHVQSAELVAHLGNWDWTLADQSHRWSDEMYRIVGYEPARVSPTHDLFTSVFHTDDRDALLGGLASYVETGAPLDIECRVVQPGGNLRHVRCVGEEIIRDEAGQAVRVTGHLQDLTAHVMMEQIAHDRDEQFRLVVESAPNGIVLTAEDGTITLVNSTLEIMFGYGHGELTGRSVEILLPEELRAGHAEQRGAFFSSPTSRPMGSGREFVARRKDGTSIPVEIGLSPLQTSTGLQVLATIVDISTRKTIEALLGEKEAFNQAVLDSMTAHVAVLDHDGIVTAVNKAWAAFAQGLEQGDGARVEPGANYLAVCTRSAETGDAGAQAALEGINAVRIGTKDRFYMEYPCHTSAEPRWFAMNVVPLHGLREGLVITHEDITARKRAEEDRERFTVQTQHLQKMEAIGTLAGGIAHEFNNSLTAVLGFSELALKALPKDHKVHRHLEQVIAAGRKSRDLVHQLLTFSQQGRHLKRPLSLHVLVKESLKLLRPLVPSWIQLHERILVPTPPVSADSSQMHQVLLNLVENALRAMRQTGGSLTITLEETRIEQPRVGPQARLEPGSYVRLMVRDTGEGMAPEIQSRIFDPFFTTKEMGEGRGMGLAVVHGIVSAHNGTVFVDSAPTVGTTVEVFLPVLPVPQPAAPSGSDEPLPQGHECVLFVDDEESLARFGGEMLESLGYYAVVRMSPAEAWQAFQMAPQRFDLLITDQTMPTMSGDALARECRRLRPDLPIILCTGSDQTLTEDAARAQGVTEFLLKPLMLHDLARTIRKVLDRAATEHPSPNQRYRDLARELVEEQNALSTRR